MALDVGGAGAAAVHARPGSAQRRTKAKELAALTNGVGVLAHSDEDEPLFILVARDIYASTAVRQWAQLMLRDHGGSPKTHGAFWLAAEMDAWREAHGGGKVPD